MKGLSASIAVGVALLLAGCASTSGSASKGASGPRPADVASVESGSDRFQQELARSTGGESGQQTPDDNANPGKPAGKATGPGGSAAPRSQPDPAPSGTRATSGPGRPDWVTQPPSAAGMAYGVGSAEIYADPVSALNRARDKARAEMVKSLRVRVSGQTQTTTRRTVNDGESTVTRSLLQNVNNRIPEVELSNVRITHTHVDESGDMAYALAVLDREAEARNLAGQVSSVDEQLEQYAGQGNDADRLKRLRSQLPALELIQKRRQIVDKYKLVSPREQSGGIAANRFDELEDEVTDLVGELRVVLVPANESARRLESTLRSALTKEGVNIYSKQSSADIRLRYDFSLNTEHKDNYFVFANGSVTVLDQSGRIIDEFQANVKGVSTRENLARSRAIDQLAAKLGEGLAGSLLESL